VAAHGGALLCFSRHDDEADWLAAAVAMAAGGVFKRQAGWFSGPSRRGWVWGEDPASRADGDQR
jgi:hypothetical protein